MGKKHVRLSDEDWEKLVEKYKAGVTPSALSLEFNMTQTGIRNRLGRDGIRRSLSEARKLTEARKRQGPRRPVYQELEMMPAEAPTLTTSPTDGVLVMILKPNQLTTLLKGLGYANS